jgi:hypothetical protein
LTATRVDATLMADDRATAAGFGATVYETFASPWPLVDASVTHDASDAADQEQSRVVEMDSVPDPPDGGNAELGAPATVTEHFVALGAETEVEVEVQLGNARTLARIVSARNRDHMTNPRVLMHGSRQRVAGQWINGSAASRRLP